MEGVGGCEGQRGPMAADWSASPFRLRLLRSFLQLPHDFVGVNKGYQTAVSQ